MPEQQDEQVFAVSDYGRVLWKRRWLVIGALFICWALVWSVSWVIPTRYRSETLIIVEQQKIPEEYVLPNVSVDLQQRLQTMTQQIMSRTRLQKIIDDFQLYTNEKRRLSPEQLVETMRKDIAVELVQSPGNREVNAFRVYYLAPDPQLAKKVASELTFLFIEENLRAQQQQSQITTEFLNSELEQARASLTEQESKVREFKSQHVGDLPTQMQSNMGILSGLQSQREGLTSALNRSQQQKLYLESLMEQYRALRVSTEAGGQSIPLIDQELSRLRNELAAAQARYTDQNPDVVRLKQEIAKTEKLKQDIDTSAARESSGAAHATSPADLQAMSPMMQIQSQLRSNAQEIKDTQAQLRAVEQQIQQYQGRLNAAPIVEQKLSDLTRDYDESKTNYDSLLKKQMQSQMATNLEKRQQGQQFRVLDPPSLPQRPFSPNRIKISVGALGVGLALGIGLVVLFELLDPRIWAEKQLQGIVAARVLVGIPHVATRDEERRLRRRTMVEWACAALMFIVVAAGNVLTLLKG